MRLVNCSGHISNMEQLHHFIRNALSEVLLVLVGAFISQWRQQQMELPLLQANFCLIGKLLVTIELLLSLWNYNSIKGKYCELCGRGHYSSCRDITQHATY